MLLDGKIISQSVVESLKPRVQTLVEQGVTPGLAVILVGDDPASQSYVRSKERLAKKVGIHSKIVRLSEDTTKETLMGIIDELNNDRAFHGILVQLPLPKHINEKEILLRISQDKDVDGFHPMNAGRLATGGAAFVPCTPKGVMAMLASANISVAGKHAVVVGRSNIVGKPMAQLLLNADATVTICHSKTKNLAEMTRQADILVAAVGRAKFITADMIKPGAVVIDVGVNRVDGSLVGDVDFDGAKNVASYITPVPGGVGLMTVAMLMTNTIEAAEAVSRA